MNPQMTLNQLRAALDRIENKYGNVPVVVWLPGSRIDLHQMIDLKPNRNGEILIEGNLREGGWPAYTVGDFRRDIRLGQYAWPGGYPRYFVMSDGEALSFKAAKAERRLILAAIRDHDSTGGWLPFGVDINWEDADLHCAHTGEPIPSAYGEPSCAS